MSTPQQLAHDWVAALAANDADAFARLLRDDASLRVWGYEHITVHRPRARIIDYLINEWSAWRDATIETLNIVANDTHIAVEFRIYATENNRLVEHNRAAFLTVSASQIATLDIYCSIPLPSARRHGWIAPANVNADQVRALFDAWQFSYDIHEAIPYNYSGFGNATFWLGGTGDAHPGSNSIIGVNWSADSADQKIHALVEYHRQRNIGFQWFVNPTDAPADLRERLERHGLVLAGDQALMARTNLDNLDTIPINPDVTVELVDGTNDEAIEAKLQIVAACFQWTPAQIAARRPNMYERIKDPIFQAREINFLARLNGTPVADARVILSTGVAYLGGASTLPAYRNLRIYSTLLRRRLEEARTRDYNVAIIHAEPMSRRVVSKYGFQEYGRAYLYAWMPAMDMQVIKSLVPDD